jgi:hypothetical protein
MGGEFLESGHLIRTSGLDRFQPHPPLLLYVPPRVLKEPGFYHRPAIVSHPDIFPTLFQIGVRDAY